MVVTETVIKCGCTVCNNPIPPQNVEHVYDPRTATHKLTTHCAGCNITRVMTRKSGADWSHGHAVRGDELAAFLGRLGERTGDVQANKPNASAAKRTLAMARPCYRQVSKPGCVLT